MADITAPLRKSVVKQVDGQTQANSSENNAGPAEPGKERPGKKSKPIVADPKDIVLASATLALSLSQGRTPCEIETLINLFGLTRENLQSILAQMLINEKRGFELTSIL